MKIKSPSKESCTGLLYDTLHYTNNILWYSNKYKKTKPDVDVYEGISEKNLYRLHLRQIFTHKRKLSIQTIVNYVSLLLIKIFLI